MADTIIGRSVEQEILRQRIESKSPELIAIYIEKSFAAVQESASNCDSFAK